MINRKLPARSRWSGILLLILVQIFVLPLPNPLQAAENLYQGRALITDRSGPEQERAMQAALRQVLQKLSGVETFDDFPETESALTAARSMAVAFYFQNLEVLLPDGSSREDAYLVVNFSPRSVDELRARLELPRWKPERRRLTAWPIVDDGLERRIMPIELEYAWNGLALLAEDRGMPIQWPEADEDGQFGVDVQLLWGGYTEELEEAGLSETLVIAARQDGPEWSVRMNLDYEGFLWSERFRGTDLVSVLDQGMNQAINQIAAKSSIAASDLGSWSADVTVSGIQNAAAYTRCLSYLQELSVVDRVVVSEARAGTVRFVVGLNAAPEYLHQYLAAGGVLLPTEQEGNYQLQP